MCIRVDIVISLAARYFFIIIFSLFFKSYFNFIRRTIYRVIKVSIFVLALCAELISSRRGKVFRLFFLRIPFIPPASLLHDADEEREKPLKIKKIFRSLNGKEKAGLEK